MVVVLGTRLVGPGERERALDSGALSCDTRPSIYVLIIQFSNSGRRCRRLPCTLELTVISIESI